MQPATAQKKDDAALNKSAAFSASTDKKKSSKTAAGGDEGTSGKKKAGPLAEGPQAKGEKGKVGAKGANKFGKDLAGKSGGGAAGAAGKAAGKSAGSKGGGKSGGGGAGSSFGGGGGPAPAPKPGGASGGGPAPVGAKGGPKAPKPKKKKTSGGGPKASGAAAAAPGGGGGGGANTSSAGTKDIAKDLVKSPMTVFAKNIGKTGKKLSTSLDKETKATHESLPEFKATMPGEAEAGSAKKLTKDNPDKKVGDGKVGPDPKKPKMVKEKAVKTKKSKEGGKAFGKLKKDTPEDILKKLFSKNTSKITSKSGQNTNPGPPPPVEFKGKSDPERAGRQNTDAQDKITKAQEKSEAKIAKIDETTLVQRKELDKTFKAKAFKSPKVSEVPKDPQMAHFSKKADQHGTAVADAANKDMQAEFEGHLGKADGDFQKAIDKQEEGKAKAVAKAEKDMEKANEKAKKDQEKAVADNRKAIDKKKKETKKKQDAEVKKAKRKGDAEKKKVEGKIKKRQKDDDKKIKGKFKAAEKKAKDKKKSAEAKAAKQKKKAEEKKKKKSFWGSICSAIGNFLDKCCKLIGDIFDALSKAVGAILNAVKDAAMAIVDAAVSFACKALDVLGDMLKGLVTGLLGNIFPGLAKALNDLIDKAVGMAKAAVKKIGEVVKKAVAAAIDGLNKAIQKVLSVAKVAIQTALTVASAVVTGDWEKALRALLEGALEMAGISPDSFYAFVGKSMDTIKKIVDNPGKFIGNLISAVGKGFGLFSDNFLKHLTNGLVGWLTGTLSDVGLKMPKNFDIKGIFDIVLQIMGLSKDKLLGKVEKKIGKDNMDLLKTVWGYAEAAIKGGLAGLWEHAKAHLSDLWDTVIDGISSWLVEKLVTQAVIKIASMFNPVGAIVQVVLTAWNVYKFVKEQAAKIYALVQSVVDGMADIVAGNLGPAAKMVEGALAKLVPIVISFLANILGLGGIANKVKDIIGKIQATVDKAVDKVIDKFWELGKKAFKAVKGAFSGDKPGDDKKADDKPAEKKKEERDPAKLPGATLITKAGTLEMGWDAQKGGNTAITKVKGGTSPFKGKVGAKVLPAMAKEADKMEGDKKGAAKGYLANAQRQVISADGSAGAWMRGEHDDLKKIKDSHKLLTDALFEAADAIGGETGGDKDASIKDHKTIIQKAGDEMVKPIGGDPKTYEEWHKDLAKRGDAVEKKWQGNLEKDVKIDVNLPNTVAQDLKDGSFEVDVKIAPNTTEERRRHELIHDEIDPAATIGDEGYKASVKRLQAIGAKLGMSAGDVEKDAKDIWKAAILTTRRTNSDVRFQDLHPKDDPDGRADLSDPAMKVIMNDLEPIIAAIEKYISGQAEQYKEGTWGFWSGKPADPVARENCQMTLEKSALGTVFDGNKIDGSWHIEMWSALSRAYAKWAAKDFEKKEFRGFVGRGSSADLSIFNKIEQPTFQMLTAKEKSEPKITFYACAGAKVKPDDPTNDWLKPDFSKSAGGCKGVFDSGDRNSMVAKAEEYLKKVQKGEDPGEGTEGTPGDPAKIPKLGYKEKDGDSHTLLVEQEGGSSKVFRHSVKKKVSSIHDDAETFKMLDLIEKQADVYLGKKKDGRIGVAGDEAILKRIQANLVKLDKLMAKARGDNDPTTKDRLKFEQTLGKGVMTHSKATGAAKDMSEKAWALMSVSARTGLDLAKELDKTLFSDAALKADPKFKKAVESCGMGLDSGFFGAVGKEYDDIEAAFKGGNLRTMTQHVIQWSEIWADKVFEESEGDIRKIIAKANELIGKVRADGSNKRGAINADSIIERKDAVVASGGPQNKKGLFGEGGKNTNYAKLKASEMDKKFPSVPIVALTDEQLALFTRRNGGIDPEFDSSGKMTNRDAVIASCISAQEAKAASAKPHKKARAEAVIGETGGGESSPMTMSTRERDDIGFGGKGSGGEGEGVGLSDKTLPFLEGMTANMLDEKNDWVKAARELKMPLKAGISGTTRRWMQTAKQLASPLPPARLAMIGHLIPTNAHSCHEVMTAAKGFVPYRDGKYLPFDPLSEAEVRKFATDTGFKDQESQDKLLGLKGPPLV